MYKRGLKTEPCGTPHKKEAEDDEKSLTFLILGHVGFEPLMQQP